MCWCFGAPICYKYFKDKYKIFSVKLISTLIFKMSSSGHSRKPGRTKLPYGWQRYTAMGERIPGTRFVPFKVPLKEEICRIALSRNNWFTPAILLQREPKLKLIIDLTDTNKYYDGSTVFAEESGVLYKKIRCHGGGKKLPPPRIIQEFTSTIDDFINTEKGSEEDALIGVHCTHGLNRTGYLICKYLTSKLGMSGQEAVQLFQRARGHRIERQLYINDILGKATESPVPSQDYRSPLDDCHSDSSYQQRRSYGYGYKHHDKSRRH